MHPAVKVALIASATVLAVTGLNLYFAPFRECTRVHGDADIVHCLRAAAPHLDATIEAQLDATISQ